MLVRHEQGLRQQPPPLLALVEGALAAQVGGEEVDGLDALHAERAVQHPVHVAEAQVGVERPALPARAAGERVQVLEEGTLGTFAYRLGAYPWAGPDLRDHLDPLV